MSSDIDYSLCSISVLVDVKPACAVLIFLNILLNYKFFKSNSKAKLINRQYDNNLFLVINLHSFLLLFILKQKYQNRIEIFIDLWHQLRKYRLMHIYDLFISNFWNSRLCICYMLLIYNRTLKSLELIIGSNHFSFFKCKLNYCIYKWYLTEPFTFNLNIKIMESFVVGLYLRCFWAL